MRDPILKPCEGSGHPGHLHSDDSSLAMCAMCGRTPMTDPTPDLAMSSDRLIELQERADEGKPFSPIAVGELLAEVDRQAAKIHALRVAAWLVIDDLAQKYTAYEVEMGDSVARLRSVLEGGTDD